MGPWGAPKASEARAREAGEAERPGAEPQPPLPPELSGWPSLNQDL